jgi:hypothetical protein
MAITYTWSVTGIKVATQNSNTNAVVQTYWKKIGTDEAGNTGEFVGGTPLSAANVTPEDFISYDSLTEDTVLTWIKAAVAGAHEEHANQKIFEQIEKKKSDASVHQVKMPWSDFDPYDATPNPNPNTLGGDNSNPP